MLAVATQTSSSHQTAAILINVSKLFLLKEDERIITDIFLFFLLYIFLVSLLFCVGKKETTIIEKDCNFQHS